VLCPAWYGRALRICREDRDGMDAHGITTPVVVGTQALREATNARAFTEPAQTILGAPIEIIAGTREAELAFLSVARTFPELAGMPYVVVDVGGGSSEVITSDGTRVLADVRLPIGAVRLTERHLAHDPPTPDEVRALMLDIDRHLATLELPRGAQVVATAGSATTLAALAQNLATYEPERVTGVRLSAMAIDHQLARLLTAKVAVRRTWKGMEPQRADVIAAGVAILSRLVHRLDAPVLITADRGVRWGVVFERTN